MHQTAYIAFTAIEGGSITMELPLSPSQDDTTIQFKLHTKSPTATESENITTVLAAALSVLVALVAVIILITACLIVHKKRSATHQHRWVCLDINIMFALDVKTFSKCKA